MNRAVYWTVLAALGLVLVWCGYSEWDQHVWMNKMVDSYDHPTESHLSLVGSDERLPGMITLKEVKDGEITASFVGQAPPGSTDVMYQDGICRSFECRYARYIGYTTQDGRVIRGTLEDWFEWDGCQCTIRIVTMSFLPPD